VMRAKRRKGITKMKAATSIRPMKAP